MAVVMHDRAVVGAVGTHDEAGRAKRAKPCDTADHPVGSHAHLRERPPRWRSTRGRQPAPTGDRQERPSRRRKPLLQRRPPTYSPEPTLLARLIGWPVHYDTFGRSRAPGGAARPGAPAGASVGEERLGSGVRVR